MVPKTNTSFELFLEFNTLLRVVAFFATIVAADLTGVFSLVPSNEIRVSRVNPCRWDRVRVLSFVLLLFWKFLLLFLKTLLGGFRTSRMLVWACNLEFLGLELRLLICRILHGISLALNLNCSGIDRTESLFAPVIYFLSREGRLERHFGLGFNCFLNNLFPSIKFSSLLLCFGFNQGFKIFPKKSNKISLF